MSYQFYKTLKNEKPNNPAYRQTVPYGMWQTRTMEILQNIFAPLHRNVFEQNWNTSMFATVTNPYYYCDFENGVYEVYLPTTIDAENHMHYWRIIVKLYDEIDKESMLRNQQAMLTPYIRPAGIIDSETICHLAKDTTGEHKHKLRCLWNQGGRRAWFKGLLRGFKHQNKRGYFTPIVVHQSPDIAAKRLLALLHNFLKTRILAMLRKLKLQDWMFQEYLIKRNFSSLLYLLEKYSVTLRTIVKNFLETFDWLTCKLKDLYAEIGRQNVQQTKIKPLIHEIKQIIDVFRKQNSLRNMDSPEPPIIQRLMLAILP